jgi:tRNA-2-methylthio-N6-dimethylallyladenosine synthase
MPKAKIITYGCQANELDSERIAGVLVRQGYEITQADEEADLVLLNTCSIREKAAHKVYSTLGTYRQLQRRRPGLRLGVCGCLVGLQGPEIERRFPELALLARTDQIGAIPVLLAAAGLPTLTGREEIGPDPLVDLMPRRESRSRAWVGITAGCDKACTYCVVPRTRGPERSRPMAEILAEVRALTAAGYRELTLLGQTVNTYGRSLDPPSTFAALLREVDAIVGPDVWVRFTSSYPNDVTPELIEAMASLPSVCEHLHLPVQSGSTRILAAMDRRYTREEYLGRIGAVRARIPEVALGTDLIVGFPGETEADFAETLSLLEAAAFDSIFAFIYSPRPHTAAQGFPDQVPEEVKRARLSRLHALQAAISLRRNRALVGRTLPVLVEAPASRLDPTLASGRTRGNRLVHFAGRRVAEGEFASVEIVGATPHSLRGLARD